MKFVGQTQIKAAFLQFIKAKKLPHCVFYGPSGCGKTTLARLIANELSANFIELDAANFSLEKLRSALANASGLYTLLIFIDEIHRLNKAQQDSLLKPLEQKDFIFIAASTINPIYALTPALNSRLLSFEFKPLNNSELEEILNDALENGEVLEEASKQYLITSSNQDARSMLNLLQNARTLGDFSLKTLKLLRPFVINQNASEYVIISALIKSIRGSDVNASIYYLARALHTGIEPTYIARRLVVLASEDIGNANPNALLLANAALQSVALIGMPEARIILAQVVVFCAQAKKSNASYKAINAAFEYVKTQPLAPIPEYLDNNSAAKAHYIYPHDKPHLRQPFVLEDLKFYSDYGCGYEANFRLWAEQGLYR